jgi:PEGA domain-containing protein
MTLAVTLVPLLILGIGVATAGGWYGGIGFGFSYTSPPYPNAQQAQLPPQSAAPVELHINPKKAAVIVDGRNVGEARDFSSRAYPMWLKFGTHVLQFSRPGYQTLLVKFEVRRGKAYKVHYDLHAGEGIDPRSSKKPQEPPAQPVYD